MPDNFEMQSEMLNRLNDVVRRVDRLDALEHAAGTATGGSAQSFTDLDDAPSSYSGAASQFVRVGTAGTSLVFSTINFATDVSGTPSAWPPSSHNHDDRYYTETELSTSGSATVHWDNLTGTPSTFPPSAHNHDDRYYTETELSTDGSATIHWGNITNEPSAWTPSNHAGSHQAGSADPIGTATPTANAIPYADGSGKLDNWISMAGISTLGIAAFTSGDFSVNGGTVSLGTAVPLYSGVPSAGRLAYWAGNGTVADSAIGTAEVATLGGTQTLNNKTLTTPTIADFSSATHDHSNAANGGTIAYSSLSGTPTVYTQEQIEDFVGGMVSGNTETNISVTYDDGGGKLNFAVPTAGTAALGVAAFNGSDFTVSDGTVSITGAGGGATDFLDLGDVPSSYSGAANQFVQVSPSGTSLVFGTVLTAQAGSVGVGMGTIIPRGFEVRANTSITSQGRNSVRMGLDISQPNIVFERGTAGNVWRLNADSSNWFNVMRDSSSALTFVSPTLALFGGTAQATSEFTAPSLAASTAVTTPIVKADSSGGLRLEDDGGNLGVYVEDGGNVGIGAGVTDPETTLLVRGATNTSVLISAQSGNSGNGNSSIQITNDTGNIGALTMARSGLSGKGNNFNIESDTQMRFYVNDRNTLRGMITSTGWAVGPTAPAAQLHVDQASTTGAKPVLLLDQADVSEEFIRFVATVGAGNPIDTAALGSYYGKVRVYVEGVGAKWIALYN